MPVVEAVSTRELHGAYFTVAAIKAANRDAGQHYFEPDTMRFFSSRVLSGTYGGRFFITSERSGFDHSSPRMFTVREAMPDGSIETVGDFNGYVTAAQARAAAKAAAREAHRYYVDGETPGRGLRRGFVVTAIDPWAALDAIPVPLRLHHMGRATRGDMGAYYREIIAR
jgi:hypothetical protein